MSGDDARRGEHGAASFERRLERLFAAVADDFELERARLGDAPRWRARARADHGYDVVVARTSRAIRVELGGWTHTEALGFDDAEVLDGAIDLVAAALWGRIEIVRTLVGGRPWRTEAIFDGAAGPRSLGTVGGSMLGWRPHRVAQRLRNRAARPPGVAMGEAGGLPTRPWIGTWAEHDTEAAREIPIDGELDLHPFSPKEVKPLVLEYIEQCRRRGITQLRIVHGKGKGHLRRTVHALLDRHEAVASYRLGGHGEGSWGATMVTLKPDR